MRDALRLAVLLREGYEAKIVGDEPLAGDNPFLMWSDGQLIETRPRRTSQPGVWLTGRDTILFATTTRDRAETLLDEARVLMTEDEQ